MNWEAIDRRIGQVLAAIGAMAATAMAMACLTGCGPIPPVCEPSSFRCNGVGSVEACSPEGQWIRTDVCSDFGPGAWECAEVEGGVTACYPRNLTDPRRSNP
jgi:hypothetical protein